MVRGNLKTIKNPQLRQQLTPDYLPGYKRVVMSNQYYKAIQQPQVNLCREDIKHFDEAGIVTSDGKHHPLDVVILATGFDARAYIGPMQLVNENGVNINDVWQHSITA